MGRHWSGNARRPQQVAARLIRDYPDDLAMRVSHERIGPRVGPRLDWFLLLFLAVSLTLGCAGPPTTFRPTLDESGTWRSVEVREGLDKDELWTAVVGVLSREFELEVAEKDSGHVRTAWKRTYVVGKGVLSERYRARLVVKLLGTDWKTVQVRSDALWFGGYDWEQGYDTILLERAYGDLQDRIGRMRP